LFPGYLSRRSDLWSEGRGAQKGKGEKGEGMRREKKEKPSQRRDLVAGSVVYKKLLWMFSGTWVCEKRA
jgi:hypothetical protein